ncbi:hypothetical protein JJB07_03845 [Tumebacillus sp. ITR2]|uniref:Lipoprotein n=1 Tax=Tumebacillus amylolyticus TaxID=2801339 RepID=A0ABS1J666_9BACL|nr:hypothetical protein [Tumebacillus amylolyticus]MBL0385773.1 hypothetical protein [Tumebacillus amylolyticus]
MHMKKSIAMLAILSMLVVGCTQEQNYLPIAQNIISEEVGNLDPYGSFYIDNKEGTKFVLALSTTDAKTDRLTKRLQKALPSNSLLIKTDYKYPVAELKKVQSQLSQDLPKLLTKGNDVVALSIDEPADKVIVDATSLTDETKANLINQYGDKIGFQTDPSLTHPTPIAN